MFSSTQEADTYSDESNNDQDLYNQFGYCQVHRDENLRARRVAGLTVDSFIPYLKTKDLAMVMFYDSCTQGMDEGKRAFVKASESPGRYGQIYAAVDCSVERSLCHRENAKPLPLYRIYANSKAIDRLTDPLKFTKYAKIFMSLG